MPKHQRALKEHRANRKRKKMEGKRKVVVEQKELAEESVDYSVALIKHKLIFKGMTSASSEALYNNISDAPSTVYGEAEFEPLKEVFIRLQLKPNLVFLDLGSGCGKAVVAAALLAKFKKLVGYEVVPSLHQLALTALNRFKSVVGPSSHIHFVQGDFLSPEAVKQWASESNVIFCFWTCFEASLVSQIQARLESVRPDTIVIVTTHQIPSPSFKLQFQFTAKNSWGTSAFFVYRRLKKTERDLQSVASTSSDAVVEFDPAVYEQTVRLTENSREYWDRLRRELAAQITSPGDTEKDDVTRLQMVRSVIERIFRSVMVTLGQEEELKAQESQYSAEFLDLIVTLQNTAENSENSIQSIASVLAGATCAPSLSSESADSPSTGVSPSAKEVPNLPLEAWDREVRPVFPPRRLPREEAFLSRIRECLDPGASAAFRTQAALWACLGVSFVLDDAALNHILSQGTGKALVCFELPQPKLPFFKSAKLSGFVPALLHSRGAGVVAVGRSAPLQCFPLCEANPVEFVRGGHATDCPLLFCCPASDQLLTVLGCLSECSGRQCFFVGDEGDSDAVDILGVLSTGLKDWRLASSLPLPSFPGTQHCLFTLTR